MNYEQIYYIVTLNVSLNIIFDKCADEKKVQIQTISICIDVYYVHLSWRQMDREIYGEWKCHLCRKKPRMESQLHRYFQINYITSIDGVDDLCQNIRTKLTYLEPKPIRHNQSQKTSAFDAWFDSLFFAINSEKLFIEPQCGSYCINKFSTRISIPIAFQYIISGGTKNQTIF